MVGIGLAAALSGGVTGLVNWHFRLWLLLVERPIRTTKIPETLIIYNWFSRQRIRTIYFSVAQN